MGYFGSVRFFKNMILLAVIIMIALPSGLAVHFRSRLLDTEQQLLLEQEKAAAQFTNTELSAPADVELLCATDTFPDLEPLQAESPYADLYPDFYAPKDANLDLRETGVIYLTFDDGPSEQTGAILDILKEKDVKATFFVIGTQSEDGKAMLRRIVEEGHTLGMHSFSHRYDLIYTSVEDYLADMYQLFTQIQEVTGTTPSLFRFPGGSINYYNQGIYQELQAEMLRRGFVPYDWNISNEDAATSGRLSAETLTNNVLKGASKVKRGIALMHDSALKTTTVQALAPTIDGLREMGFELKALTPDVIPILYSYRE